MIDYIDIIKNSPGKKEQAATAKIIHDGELSLGVYLPLDFKTCLAFANGFAAEIKGVLLFVWSVDQIIDLNPEYLIPKYVPGLVAIGSDGGENCLCFDYREHQTNPPLVRVPFGDLSFDSIKQLSVSFSNFIEAVDRHEITTDDIDD